MKNNDRDAGVTRRQAVCGLALALSGGATGVLAAGFPSRPVRIIVPYTPGGVTDMTARNLARRLGETLGQPVVVENQPGAAATLGAKYVARQQPDGHTLLLGTNGTHGTNSSTFANLGYDPLKDFAPIALLGQTSLMLVVRPDLPVRTFGEFMQFLKTSAKEASYASTGRGGGVHLITEYFMMQTGTNMLHVPYKGSSQALNELMGGHVDVMFDNLASSLPLVAAGKLRALAVTGERRSSLAPDVLTLREFGVTDFEASNWLAIFAPAGTPSHAVAKLNQAINDALQEESLSAALRKSGFEPAGGTPERLRDKAEQELEKWARVTRKIGLRPE